LRTNRNRQAGTGKTEADQRLTETDRLRRTEIDKG